MPLRSLLIFFAITTAALGVVLLRAQNPQAPQSTAASATSPSSPISLILQENDGEHRLRRPGGPTGSSSVSEFIIRIDKQNGNAEDFYVATEKRFLHEFLRADLEDFKNKRLKQEPARKP